MIYLKLALKMLRFEWRVSLVLIAALAAVLAPLMLLWSLRSGVISNLEHQIIDNPDNMEIVIAGNEGGRELYEFLKNDPDVAFVAPKPITLNAEAVLRSLLTRKFNQRVTLYPTGKGDPLVEGSGIDAGSMQDTELVLSTALAKTLDAKPGDEINLSVTRRVNGEAQKGQAVFTVKGILDPAYSAQQCAYLTTDTLIYLADYKSGNEPPIFSDGSTTLDKTRYFAGVRLYARSLDSVLSLTEKIHALHREISGSKAADVQNLKAVDSVLTSIFLVVVAVSAVGGAAAFYGLIHMNLHSRSRTMAMLLLMGMDKVQLTLFAALKNALCALAALILSWTLYQCGALIVNAQFSQALRGADIASLSPQFMLLLFAAAEILVSSMSVVSMYFNYARKQTAQLLRG